MLFIRIPMTKYPSSILVVGAGSLGSEVIKIWSSTGISMVILDYDTIEISNLNRQFYYVQRDIGSFKSKTISDKINKSHCKYIVGKLEEYGKEFYEQFDLIIGCLDSVSARMELNYRLFKFKWFIPSRMLIDCGVEGLSFHVKRVTVEDSCMYCLKDLFKRTEPEYLCSLVGMKNNVTRENRKKVLRSIVIETEKVQEESEEDHVKKVTDYFNSLVERDLQTTVFEVKGIYYNIIPNIVTINSICASYSTMIILKVIESDFIFSDGTDGLRITNINLLKDENCFICKRNI